MFRMANSVSGLVFIYNSQKKPRMFLTCRAQCQAGGGVRKGRQVVLETIKFYILISNRLTFYGRQNVHSNLKKKK